MSDTPEFVNGLIIKPPHEKAPDFVKCAISIRREELITWLTTKQGDWINLDVKVSKNDKWYAQVNDFKPKPQTEAQNLATKPNAVARQDFDDQIPF